MPRLSFHKKVLYVFCGLTLVPLIILAIFAGQSLNTVEQLLRVSAIEALDDQAAEALELRAIMVANEVRTLLHRVENDLGALAQLSVDPRTYLWFSQSHSRPIWIRTGTNAEPREERPTIRLYSELAFIGPDGMERLRVVDGVLVEALRNVSDPANTTYLTETYFNDARGLPEGRVSISHVTGWHVSKRAQLAGVETPEEAIEGASYEGVIRFAQPVFTEDHQLKGVVLLSLDHRHLMEFTQHISPTDERFVVFPSYQSGNYAFMFDNEGWIITHPKFWDIRGLDEDGHLVPPYTTSSSPESIASGKIPYNLREAAFIHPNYPKVHQAVLAGRSGVVDVTNVGGSQKIMAFAPILFDSGPFAEKGVFGGITIGAEVKQFHKMAESASLNIRLLYKTFLTGAWVLIGLTTMLVVFVAYRLSHNITGPLSTLIAGTQEMARGKLGTQVKIESPVEIAELAAAFNTMAWQLKERRERLLKTLAVLRRSRKEIKQERDFKQTIVENVEVGILTLDSSQYVTSLNGAARDILKINDESIDPLPLNVTLSHFPELYEAIPQSVQSERWSEYTSLERSGRSLTYRLTLHPLSSGREYGHILTIEDLTERVSSRQQMARLERLASLGRLSAGIAHEVRNPLTGISLLLDELHDRMLARPGDQGLIQRALQEIERLEGLVNELLNFASMPDTRLVPGDLAVALRDTLFLVSKQFEKQRVSLHEDVPAELLHPRMDSDRLKQAILNLLTNALAAMEDGGELWVAAQRVVNGIRLTIRDTGQGISADRLALIFEPFYTTKGAGTGLGLSITHTIITSHGGHIEVQSREGKGTEFRIFLPDSGQK
jgi:signal transduction histidine kinase/HAMP domain-containing protein